MDAPPPAAVTEEIIVDALARWWSVEVRTIAYVPKGGGSYHWRVDAADGTPWFVTVDDLATKPWIGTDHDAVFASLCVAYDTARQLQHDGYHAVVAPVASGDGASSVRLLDRYSVAVFPFVDGRAGEWGTSIDPAARTELIELLARLHATTGAAVTSIARRRHELPEIDALAAALAAIHQPWTGGDYSEACRRALLANERAVRDRLARFAALASQLADAKAPVVLTHGEPHPGNLIWTGTGICLIDWDTVQRAEPERDLWMFADHAGALDAYTARTGRTVDAAAIEFYRLTWTLSDIASIVDALRHPHIASAWTERKWEGLLPLLEGAYAQPYGPPGH